MATPNLKGMDVDALLALRSQIDARLADKRHELEKQLSRLGGGVSGGRGSSLKGRKVAPKYADPKTGATWAGRGARPKWLAAALKAGQKLEDFMIDKTGVGARKRGYKRRK
jgi:DNA-binding protein H-NS